MIGPGPDFDPQYAMTTDLDEPLIIASVTADGTGQPCPLLIDGYALLVTVRSEVAVVQWSVPESVRLTTPADSTIALTGLADRVRALRLAAMP